MAEQPPKQALIMRECLSYPSPNAFSRVIGLTNRPLTKDASMLPSEKEKWELHSGIDLEKGADVVAEKLNAIDGIERTNYVYFTSYTAHGSDYQTLKQASVTILRNAVQGGKAYGVEFIDKGIDYNPSLKEDMPRIAEPYTPNIFYYAQYDIMKRLSEGKRWNFCEIRPDAIIGFVPQNNAMNLAQALGLCLAMYKSVEGSGAKVLLPGNKAAYQGLHTDTSQAILARFAVPCFRLLPRLQYC